MRRGVVLLIGILGCSKAAPEPELTPVPYTPPPVAAPPSSVALSPSRVAGSYRMRAVVERQRQRGAARPTLSTLVLGAQPVAAPDPAIASATQFNASVSLQGYTRAPRGRSGAAAAWYPIPGDSMVIQVATSAQPGAQIQLRGALDGRNLRGDIWFVTDAGTTFQLGTFTATRQGR